MGNSNWGDFYRSIHFPFPAGTFLRADGREYLYARLFHIESDYILPRYLCLPNRRNLHGKHEAVAPLTFEFSRGEREREIPDSRQIANPTSAPRVISTSQIFARQFYATLLYYLNDLLPSPNFFVLRSDDFCTSNRTLISYSLETSIKNDVGGEATSNFTSSSSFSFFYSETHRYKSSARISLDRTRFFRNIIYNVKNVSASNFRLAPPPSSSIVLISKRGLIRSNFVAQVYPFVSLLLFPPHRLETRAAATQTFAQR